MAFIGGLLLGFFIGVAVSCVLLAKKDVKSQEEQKNMDNTFQQSLDLAKTVYHNCLKDEEEASDDIESTSEED